MSIELATKLTYFALGLSFLILCGSFWVLKMARKHLHGVERLAKPWWFAEQQDTLILPNGYHKGF